MNFKNIALLGLMAGALGAANATVATTSPVAGTTLQAEDFNGGTSFDAGWFNAPFSGDDYLWLSTVGSASSTLHFNVGALQSLELSFAYKTLGDTSSVSLTGPGGASWNLSSTGLGFLLANPGPNTSFSTSLSNLAAGNYSLTFAVGGPLGLKVDDLTITTVAQLVPEPESYALMLAGLGVVGFLARRRSRA
jgi:hypothetical protein